MLRRWDGGAFCALGVSNCKAGDGWRVSHQLGSAGTRRTPRTRTFDKPTAVVALPGERALVANSGSHCLTVVSLVSGATILMLPLDGVPCGVCLMPRVARSAGDAAEVVVVSVQGESESGVPEPGVINTAHRLEAYDLCAPGAPRLWVYTPAMPPLSYPNGIAFSPELDALHVCDWNNHRVLTLRMAESGQPIRRDVVHDEPDDVAVLDQRWRPADVAVLPLPVAGGIIACVDYYGNAARLFVRGVGSAQYAECAAVGAKRRSRKPCLERPSGIAVDPSSTLSSGSDRVRILISETGAQCISVFEIRLLTAEAMPQVQLSCSHLCDMGVEQLGSGLHAPLRGLWGWLGISCTAAGDVLVADCDNRCLLVL